MQSLKRGLAAVAVLCAFTVTAQAAECARITALGQTLTHDTAVLFANNALKNTLASQGRIGKGPVTTTCKTESAMITCHSSQVACTGGTPKTCLGAWFCF
jgi:hypothetical protein